MENIYFILISLALLLGFMIWKEFRRKNRSNLILRLCVSALAVIALYFIAAPLSYQKQIDPGNEHTVVLLTEGYEKDSLAGIKMFPRFSTDREIAKKDKTVKLIPDLDFFLSSNPGYTKFHILGYGLEERELKSLSKEDLDFHPSVLPDGIISVSWQAKIRSGDQLLVQGSYHNRSGKDLMLILNGLGTNLDSVTVKKGTTSVFQLSCIPKHLDKAVYTLTGIAENDTITQEKIPVLVEEQEPLRILLLASSPDFENKFLKNWLYTKKHTVSSRTAISKDKFSMEFLNSGKNDLGRIKTALLEKFDILIGDMAELSRLSPAENQAIRNQINAGMGLIIKSDGPDPASGFYRRAFILRENKQADQKIISLNWDGYKAKKTVLPGSVAAEILPQPGTQALVRNERGIILVNSKLYGKGRIILSTLSDSYTWMLGNNTGDYTSFWSLLLEKAARRKELTHSWSVNTFPLVNKGVRMEVENLSDSIPQALANESRITLKQDPVLDFRWSGTFWPLREGWQTFGLLNSDKGWLYVSGEKSWKGILAAEKSTNTRKVTQQARADNINEKGSFKTIKATVPAIWFYLLFILCCTYLWLEAKML